MKLYQNYDLILYFYIYAFLGWMLETIFFYIRDGKIKNRGVLNEPLIMMYGTDMILLILGSGVSQAHIVFQFVLNIFRVFLIRVIDTFFHQRMSGVKIRRIKFRDLTREKLKEKQKQEQKLMLQRAILDVCVATVTFAAFKILHPFVYIGVSLLPVLLIKILCICLGLLVAADFILVMFLSVKDRKIRRVTMTRWQERIREEKMTLTFRMVEKFHERVEKAYPSLYKYTEEYEGVEAVDAIATRKGIIFAEGICIDKLIWVFLISSLLGDGIETIFVRIVGGSWMRRSGVVFGPFSIVWGVGAALLTIALYRLSSGKKYKIFLGGFFLGGTYEYTASVVLETLFHTKFWDYSKIPLNIGGRTNVPYMIGWGALSLMWICVCYPAMSHFIEKFPPLAGKITTWTLMAAMTLDLAMTGAVMIRYNMRKNQPKAKNQLERYLDTYYTDKEVEQMWPNIVKTE